jgi:DNA-binding GntR family transcriptional regulator/DNA-binding transcriptional LysR family regulator
MDEARTIANDVYEQLRHEIISCRLLPGSKINIQSMVQKYDVSLGAVREALSKLSAEGLVNAKAQRGYTVADVSPEDLAELTDARVKIESECLRLAIENGGLDWETDIVAALHRLNNTPYTLADDPAVLDERWVKAHREYHKALVSACGNRWLLRVRAQLYDQSERYRQLSVPLARKERDVAREHRQIADAVIAKDAEKACDLISAHLWKTTDIVTTALTEAGDVYLRRIRPLLQELVAAGQETERFSDGAPRGKLRLALPGSFGRMWLMPLLVEFREAYPTVRLDVAFSNRFVDLIGEGFDLAVRLGVLPDSRLVSRKLAERKRMIVASPKYLAERGIPETPEDVLAHDCLIFAGKTNPGTWEFTAPRGRQLSVPVAGSFVSDDAEALVHAAVAGHGLLYATDWLVGRELADGRLVRILEHFPIPDEGAIYIVHPSMQHVPNKTRAFIDWIILRFVHPLPWHHVTAPDGLAAPTP